MKKQTHPQTIVSLIQNKDGSFFIKKWLYFRSSLFLETDLSSNTIWKKDIFSKNNNFFFKNLINLKK